EQSAQLEQIVHHAQIVRFAIRLWSDSRDLVDSRMGQIEGVPQFVHQRRALHERGPDRVPGHIEESAERQHHVSAGKVTDARDSSGGVEAGVVADRTDAVNASSYRVT